MDIEIKLYIEIMSIQLIQHKNSQDSGRIIIFARGGGGNI